MSITSAQRARGPDAGRRRPARRCGAGGSGATSEAAATRVVEHLGGRTTITGTPQRIVALDGGEELETLSALGISPLAGGEASYNDEEGGYYDYLSKRCDLDDVRLIRGRDEFNAEELARLRPDLILAEEGYIYIERYDTLSRIAPTVIMDREDPDPAERLRPIAAAVGRPEAAGEILDLIARRKAEVAATLPDDLEISIAETNGVDFAFYWPTPTYLDNPPALLRELGVSLPAHQRAAVGADEYAESDSFEVSAERIDLLDGQNLLLRLLGPEQEVLADLGVAFSPNGKMLASASHDQTVRLWDAATGEQIGQPLIGHTYTVPRVAFSPDGETLASASGDSTVRLWPVTLDAWIQHACTLADRNLSQGEWDQFVGF